MPKVPYSRGRVVLIVVAVLSLVGFVVVERASLADLARVVDRLDGTDWAVVAAAAAVQLFGHVLRAARTKVPLDNVRRGSLAGQFRHLTIGYLFSTVWPLRIGEVVRAWLMARTVRISFLYTLAAVVLERLIDVVLVSVAFLLLVVAVQAQAAGPLVVTAVVALVVAVTAIALFAAFVREQPLLLKWAWRATSMLNSDLENRARFKLWSVIFGFQRFLRQRRQLVRYAALAIGSWSCYVVSTALVAVVLLPGMSAREGAVATAAPSAVVSPSLGSGTPDGYVERAVDFVTASTALDPASVVTFAAVSWLVVTVPVVLVGLLAVFVNWASAARQPQPVVPAPGDGYVNKLGRDADISGSMTHFLAAYFQRQHLSQVLHRLEVTGNVSLVQFFKGGSNAVTLLATSGDELYVRKMVPAEHAHRLKNQHDWLAERADHTELVTVLREVHADDHYAIDIEYRPSSVPLAEYVHENPLAAGTAKLAEVWTYMYDRVYRDLTPVEEHTAERDEYVQERFVQRVRAATESHPALAEAMLGERIVVNGAELDNFDAVLDRITSHPVAWADLSMFRTSRAIHGDLTVDNILVDLATDRVLVIDPSDDNQIRGPVIDFARHMQSLLYGYEFLNDDETPVVLARCDGVAEINYRDVRSARYASLADYVTTQVMPARLTVSEQRAVLFHVGLFYGRMLTHRVAINPGTALKYYAVSIQALNRFLDQYETTTRDEDPSYPTGRLELST